MSNALGCDLARLVGAAEQAHDACIGNGRFSQRIHVLDRGGWQHCLGLPRELTAGQNGALRQQPVREVEGMRGAETAVTGELAIEGDAARCFDFIAMGIDASFELVLADGLRLAWLPAGEGLPARLELRFLDESRGGIGFGRTVRWEPLNRLADLRVVGDASSVEPFANGDELCLSTRYYPERYGLSAHAPSADLRFWPLG